MPLYPREQYLARLRPFYTDTELIKVIAGIRRCGKSSLMSCIADELRSKGVPDHSIVYLNLDSRKLRKITKPDDLDRTIESHIPGDGMVYLFIDEVQNVKGFESVILHRRPRHLLCPQYRYTAELWPSTRKCSLPASQSKRLRSQRGPYR